MCQFFGVNIDQAFNWIAEKGLSKQKEDLKNDRKNVKFNKPNSPSPNSCC